jgi:hypothetical protein
MSAAHLRLALLLVGDVGHFGDPLRAPERVNCVTPVTVTVTVTVTCCVSDVV